MEGSGKRTIRARRAVMAEQQNRLIRECGSSGLKRQTFCRCRGITLQIWDKSRHGPGFPPNSNLTALEHQALAAGGFPINLTVTPASRDLEEVLIFDSNGGTPQ